MYDAYIDTFSFFLDFQIFFGDHIFYHLTIIFRETPCLDIGFL